SPSNSASGQIVSWAPSPMTRSSAGSDLLPVASYSISMPFALTRATLPPLRCFSQPRHDSHRRVERRLGRGIGGGRVVCNGRPRSGNLNIAAKLLESEAAVRPAKQIDAAVVISVLDAVEHDPRFVDTPGHLQYRPERAAHQ